MYVFEYPEASSVPTGALPNNGIVVALSTTPPGETLTFSFQCRSDAVTDWPSDRQFIGLDGQPRGTNGALSIGKASFQPSVIFVNNANRGDLSAEEEGVYTCRMLDENWDTVEVNVGLYRNRFNSE